VKNWTNCSIQIGATKAAYRSWFDFVLSDDHSGPIRAAIHEGDDGRAIELRAVFIVGGIETEFRRLSRKDGFVIEIRDPRPWPVR
jgi:hypothetical protein